MRMMRALAVTAVAALSLTATGFADPGGEKKAKKNGKYTFTVTTTDNGSCGQPWATDVVRRTFHF
jgi:nicotinamide mononucleotide (NMN) deamidase PncC